MTPTEVSQLLDVLDEITTPIERIREMPAEDQARWDRALSCVSRSFADDTRRDPLKAELRTQAKARWGEERARKWLSHFEAQAAIFPRRTFQQAVIDRPRRTKMAELSTVISAVSAVGSLSSLFSSKSSPAPEPPAVEKPAVMPTPDDDAVKKARRRSLMVQQARSGRASTILSNDDTLGA